MTEKVKKQLEYLKSGEYKKIRRDLDMNVRDIIKGEDEMSVQVKMLEFMLKTEEPYLSDYDGFGFTRTVKSTPYVIDDNGNRIRITGPGNVVPDYSFALQNGFDKIIEKIKELKKKAENESQIRFYDAAESTLELTLDFAKRYRDEAKKQGKTELYNALCVVPQKRAESFYQALVFMKFLHFILRCNRTVHVTFGRFDQYMYPFYKADLEKGIARETLFEQLEGFFVSMNFDGDLFPGVQLGDNGQSMVLGGVDENGNDQYNGLSNDCMEASLELNLIDPKINLRVNKNTPIERLEYATCLTKKGLGFPQYCNDDVIIPGLEKLGYSHKDASNYAVAACWECIPSNNGFDIANIAALNFPLAIEDAVNNHLEACETYGDFEIAVKNCLEKCCDDVIKLTTGRKVGCSPLLSVFIGGCLESGRDISEHGAKYNNYGIHGVGISTAADSMIAVKYAVFKDKKCSCKELVDAVKSNFEGYGELRNYLLNCPKMGNNNDEVDNAASFLMQIFSDYINARPNDIGGVYRAGTGSAMEYILSAKQVKATPDGRYAGTPYGSSFSPSVTARLKGPLSCIQSFTKFDMTDIVNGGPLTMEMHSTVFRNDEGIKKVARLVKEFIDLSGHQLQINSVNRETLLDAQKHPENHKNLIVRVWGWSGYFNELDREYQDHIIKRTEFFA